MSILILNYRRHKINIEMDDTTIKHRDRYRPFIFLYEN